MASLRGRRRARSLLGCLILMSPLACGRESETVLSVNFDNDPLGSLRTFDQEVGTARAGNFGTVRVVASPLPATGAELKAASEARRAGGVLCASSVGALSGRRQGW